MYRYSHRLLYIAKKGFPAENDELRVEARPRTLDPDLQL